MLLRKTDPQRRRAANIAVDSVEKKVFAPGNPLLGNLTVQAANLNRGPCDGR
jgi:hypothetical protein